MDDFKTQLVPDPVPAPNASAQAGESKPVSKSVKPKFETKAVPDSPQTKPATVQPFIPENPHLMRRFFVHNKWYLFALMVGLIIIGILAFFAFRPQKQEPTQKAKVGISFDAPTTAPASGDVIYKLRIQNNDSVKLVGVELELLYPQGMSYVSSTPKADNLSGTLFKIPDLPAGTDIPLVLKVGIQGDVNSELKLVARLNYKYDKFVSLFTEESSHAVRLSATDVILDFTGPNTISGNQSATYDLYYRNNSKEEIPNARVVLTYPQGFVFSSSVPNPTMGQNSWDVGTVKSQEGGKITIQGNFNKVTEGSGYEFVVEFQAQDESGNYYAQATTRHETNITSQPLIITHEVVSGAKAGIVSPGDELTYNVTFRNNSSVVATGVNIEAQIDSTAISPSEIEVDGGAVKGNTIVWNASSSPVLARLGPADSGTVKFGLKVNNPATTKADKNLVVKTKVRIQSNEEKTFWPGNEIILKVSSPASLAGTVNPVSGPLPLKVGQQTTLRVTLEIRNSSNDLNKGNLTGVIPIGVNLDLGSIPKEESNAVKYDATTGRFSWEVGGVPAFSGRSAPTRKLNMIVSTVPSANQVYDAPTLLQGITMSAKDAFTDQTVNLKIEDLTTANLPGENNPGRVEP